MKTEPGPTPDAPPPPLGERKVPVPPPPAPPVWRPVEGKPDYITDGKRIMRRVDVWPWGL